MADPSRQTTPAPWQRFTLLDAFLIQLAFALGFSAAAILKPKETSAAFVLVAGSLFGALACGPIVLWVQWAIRDRWIALSAGEWLWLVTAILQGVGFCAGILIDVSGSESAFYVLGAPVAVAWLLAQLACLIPALWTLILTLAGARADVPCGWTDRVGIAVSLLGNLATCIVLSLARIAAIAARA